MKLIENRGKCDLSSFLPYLQNDLLAFEDLVLGVSVLSHENELTKTVAG